MTPYGIIPWKPVEAGIVGRLTLADARVYLVVCAHVRDKEWLCFPGVKKIAKEAGLTTRAVHMATARLVALGLFTVERGGGRDQDGEYRKTVYKLTGNGERPFSVPKGVTVNAGAVNGEPGRTLTVNAGAAHKEEEQQMNNIGKNGGAAAPLSVPQLPAVLDTEAFRTAWAEWLKHLRQKRKNPTDLAVKRQLAKLASLGPAEAVRWLDHAIEHNWQGLYPPDQAKRGGKYIPATTAVSYDDAVQHFDVPTQEQAP